MTAPSTSTPGTDATPGTEATTGTETTTSSDATAGPEAQGSVAVATPFDRVPLPLRTALRERGFTELTTVQLAALDAIDGSRDLRISSQTGSGKTVAFGIAIAPELLANAAGSKTDPSPSPEALVIVPTRELAAQVHKELEWLYAAVPGVRIDCVTGGTNVGNERRRLKRAPRILVGTPGRLVDHIGSGALKCNGVKQLVLDEADQMLEMGFREDLDTILAAMPTEGRRTHMLSATFPPAVKRLAKGFQTDPLHVEGTRLGDANEDIVHVAHVVKSYHRYGALVNLLLLAGDERSLVFVATRADATTLAEKLAGDGFSALPLSGELAQAQRTRTLNAFRAGSVSVLVATDVAARGLDVPDVASVIHGDLPMDGEIYTHRSGRTGRAGRKGRSVLLVSPNGERRARRLLTDAGVEAQFLPAPNAAAVEKSLMKRARRRVRQAIDTTNEAAIAASIDFAKDLLDGRDAARVVASLLANAQTERIRAPFDIETPMPMPAPGAHHRAGDQRDNTTQRRSTRAPDPRKDGAFAQFRVNWGFRNGANPKRILAAICRRGDVSSRLIGAIEIGPYSATFDVATEVASEFESRTRRRDPRDPDQRIERVKAPAEPKKFRRGPRARVN